MQHGRRGNQDQIELMLNFTGCYSQVIGNVCGKILFITDTWTANLEPKMNHVQF
jgi:hypothetical protein